MAPLQTTVKVCGITRKEDARVALDLGARYIGINVYPPSPRSVAARDVQGLLEYIPQGQRVLVDVAPDAQRVQRFADLGFDFFQLHFDLDLPMSLLSTWFTILGQDNIWAAPRIPGDQLEFPQVLLEFADTFLLDSYDPKLFGGTGKAGQNWQRFLDCSVLYQHKRWILAGGLSPENAVEAVRATGATHIDVNSGVESSPGIKDPGRLRLLFEALREAELI